METLKQLDLFGKSVLFLIANINRICHVFGALRDEIQMRHELQTQSDRTSALEAMFKSHMSTISTKIDNISSMVEDNQGGHTRMYSEVTKSASRSTVSQVEDVGSGDPPGVSDSTDEACRLGGAGRVAEEVKPIQINPAQITLPIPNMSTADTTPKTSTPILELPSPSWKGAPKTVSERKGGNVQQKPKEGWIVQKKKQRKQKRPSNIMMGQNVCHDLKSSDKQPLRLFVSWCHVETTAESITTYLQGKGSWKVSSVTEYKTQFDFFKSFVIVIQADTDKTKDYLNPAQWPKGWYVKKYYPQRKRASSQYSKPQ